MEDNLIKSKIELFLEYLTYQKRYSKHTISAYRGDLLSFADYLELFFELSDPEDVNKRMVGSWMADMMDHGLTPRSVNRKLSSVQSFYEFLIRSEVLSQNPAKQVQRPKSSAHLPSVVRSEHIQSLFTDFEFENSFEGSRDRFILAMFYSCGLRRDELINLTLDRFDASSEQLKVRGKRNKERIVPIAPALVKMYQEYNAVRNELSPDNNFLFVTAKGEKLYPNLVYKIVKKYLSQVTTMDKKSPHVLRHTFATHLLNEGANLQSIKELLGHTSLAATQVYTHTSLEKLKEVYNKSHPRSKN